MYCHKCGKEIPDGAKYCNYCGEAMPEAAPRHARPEPEPEELYSFSDKSRLDPIDTGVTDPLDRTRLYENLDETKVYNFEAFEEHFPAPDEEPLRRPEDDREIIGDSYELYRDGDDDDTFMDKLDNRFRRDDYDDHDDRRRKNSKAWLWITLGVLAAVLIVVFAVMAFSGKLFGGNNKPLPTVRPTAAATVKPTEKPRPTQAPKPTQAPEPTKAPDPTQAPEPTEAPKPPTEAPQPITEAPKPPTEAPAEPTEPPAEPTQEPASTAETNAVSSNSYE